jgi:hypothetical protein
MTMEPKEFFASWFWLIMTYYIYFRGILWGVEIVCDTIEYLWKKSKEKMFKYLS